MKQLIKTSKRINLNFNTFHSIKVEVSSVDFFSAWYFYWDNNAFRRSCFLLFQRTIICTMVILHTNDNAQTLMLSIVRHSWAFVSLVIQVSTKRLLPRAILFPHYLVLITTSIKWSIIMEFPPCADPLLQHFLSQILALPVWLILAGSNASYLPDCNGRGYSYVVDNQALNQTNFRAGELVYAILFTTLN